MSPVIAMMPVFDRTAVGLMKILTTTSEYSIKLEGLVRDCFDGASVNSGWKNGTGEADSDRKMWTIYIVYSLYQPSAALSYQEDIG